MSDERDETRQNLEQQNLTIVRRREAGASWWQIQEEFGLTRQQARYAYQLGKRALRRAH